MATTRIKIIGVDCAVDRKNVGLAVGLLEGGRARLLYPEHGSEAKWQGAGVQEIVRWVEGDAPVLLALDAPLGWPICLAPALAGHQAGKGITQKPNEIFRRTTDKEVQATLKLRPLDVGADKIASTAHAALRLLDEIRYHTGQSVPLAWKPEEVTTVQAIEVYPAATLRSHELPHDCYKKQDSQSVACKGIIQGLRDRLEMSDDVPVLKDNSDVLDAAVCVLAGVDFLMALAIEPNDLELAKTEGWIWVRRTKHGSLA
jgi:Protein of unknown function (DUF429)